MSFRGFVRLVRILWLVAVTAAGYGLYSLTARYLSAERRRRWLSRIHTSSAERIYRTSVRLKGAFLKVGQFVSTRIDLLPKEYVPILARLQDQVPPVPYRVIRAQIVKELGRPPEDVFVRFSTTPLAAASLGQVHEAEIPGGLRVAVKVQLPHMEEIVLADLANLGWLTRHFSRFLGDGRDLATITRELTKYVSREVDYIREGKTAEKFRENFRNFAGVVIPKIHWNYTTERVLTMDFIEGERITDAFTKAKADGAAGEEKIGRVTSVLTNAFCKQTLADGLFHADPHPGNFLVAEDGTLGLVDFGCVKDMPVEMRMDYVRLAKAIVQRDTATMGQVFSRLGFQVTDGHDSTLERLAFTYMDVFIHDREANFQNLDFERVWRDMMETARSHPFIQIPQDFVLLGRVFIALTGLSLTYKPQINYFQILLPYLFQLLQASREGAAASAVAIPFAVPVGAA